jgi:hypothetical protein
MPICARRFDGGKGRMKCETALILALPCAIVLNYHTESAEAVEG